MANDSKQSGLEIWPPVKDQSTHSVCLPVGVFSPSQKNGADVCFHVGFLTAPEFTVTSVRTDGKCTCVSSCGQHQGYPVKHIRQDDGRLYHLVDGAFTVPPEGSEMFYVAFCWNAAFPPGDVLAFTVRVQTKAGTSDWNLKFRLV